MWNRTRGFSEIKKVFMYVFQKKENIHPRKNMFVNLYVYS